MATNLFPNTTSVRLNKNIDSNINDNTTNETMTNKTFHKKYLKTNEDNVRLF